MEVQEEEDEEEESDLEDGQDVSEKGMQRLMAALGDDGLDEVDMAALDELAGDEDDEDDEDEEDEDEEDLEEEAEEDDEEDAAEEVDDDIRASSPTRTATRSLPRSHAVDWCPSKSRTPILPTRRKKRKRRGRRRKKRSHTKIFRTTLSCRKRPRRHACSASRSTTRRHCAGSLRTSLSTRPPRSFPWIETMRIVYPSTISSSVTDVENDLRARACVLQASASCCS